MEELDLKELLGIFWNKKIYILLIVAIFIVVGVIYTYVFVTPDYESTTTIILAQSSSAGTGTDSETITATDLTLNKNLVSTYSELIKSKTILREVINNLNINKSEASLKNNITVSAVEDTDLIKIRVTDADPEIARQVAAETADVFIAEVANGVYKINNVQVWDEAETATAPYNVNHIRDIIIFMLVGFVVAFAYVLIANMLDTTIKSAEDVEKYIGLPVLASIPEYIWEEKGGSKK